MFFDERSIKEISSAAIVKRGRDYFNQGRVEILELSDDNVLAKVYGSYEYEVSLVKKGKAILYYCDCPYPFLCKHIVATMLAVNEREITKNLPVKDWKKFFEYLNETENKEDNKRSKMVFFLALEKNRWSIRPILYYVKKDGNLGRRLSFSSYDPNDKRLNLTSSEKLVVKYLEDYYYNYSYFDYGSEMGQLLLLLKNSMVFLEDDLKDPVSFYPNDVDLTFEVEKNQEDYRLSLFLKDGEKRIAKINHEFKLLTSGYVHFYKDKTIYSVKQNLSESYILPFTGVKEGISIPEKEFNDFVTLLFPKLISAGADVILPEEIKVTDVEELNNKYLYLSENNGELRVYLKFGYSDEGIEVNAFPFQKFQIIAKGKKLYKVIRQKSAENLWIEFLRENGLEKNIDDFILKKKINPIDWLLDVLPVFAEKGFQIFGEDKLDKLKIRRSTPKIISRVSSGIDWFDLSVEIDFDGLRVSYFEIMESLRKKKKYIRLNDGSTVRLDESILERLGLISHFAHADSKEKTLKLSRTQALLVEQILKSSSKAESDDAFKKQIKKFRKFKEIKPQEIPKGFKGKLRPYQKAGYDWLCFLNEYGFGGCLADDMGLGKTVQTLALLQREKNRKKGTSLIIAPTSVLPNWEREAQRFTPELKVLVHSGMDRVKSSDHFRKFDLVVTSYGLLRRDFEYFQKVRFNYVILDESQKIKNPHSISARTAWNIRAKRRLVLTGTPIENNLSELWSQFQFINPGMLGKLDAFQKYYAKAIEREGDREKADQLKKLIYPFILRRSKEEVIKELPPKVENILYCQMDEWQEKEYEKWRDFYRAQILEQINQKGLNRSKMKVLEGLTRLRQLSIHPAMVDSDYDKSSGKFDALWDLLEDILSERHKVLVFSQFVKALTIVRNKLDSQKTPYAYLDGRTRKRQQIIDQFQNDPDIPIFLISLKAGGLGLNLTAADYVVHIDPWWNPAVENQATDRTHRIGQNKKVFVYKMITKDTVEEKILELQNKKKRLADELISMDSAFFKVLTQKDIEHLFT